MKAITFYNYGGPEVLKLEEVQKPEPREKEVLVKIHATGMNAADWHLMRANPFIARLAFGIRKPKISILGADIAGVVEEIGKSVTKFKVGDEVFADLSGDKFGGYAEYVSISEDKLVLKPKNLSFQEAAAVPLSSITALQALRKGGIKSGKKVLINGASGGVGSYALQIAKSMGAEVTAVTSTKNLELAKNLGADFVIDYTKEDFSQNGKSYDLILGVNGYQSLKSYKKALSRGGSYVMVGGGNKQLWDGMLKAPFIALGSGKKMGNVLAKYNPQDLEFIKNLIEDGKVKPVIDRTYKLEEVPEAMRYLEAGHARGKIVIKVDSL